MEILKIVLRRILEDLSKVRKKVIYGYAKARGVSDRAPRVTLSSVLRHVTIAPLSLKGRPDTQLCLRVTWL